MQMHESQPDPEFIISKPAPSMENVLCEYNTYHEPPAIVLNTDSVGYTSKKVTLQPEFSYLHVETVADSQEGLTDLECMSDGLYESKPYTGIIDLGIGFMQGAIASAQHYIDHEPPAPTLMPVPKPKHFPKVGSILPALNLTQATEASPASSAIPKCERELISGFATLVPDLQVPDVAVTASDRPVAHIEDFGFRPVVSNAVNRSITPAGYEVVVPPGVRATYDNFGQGRPFLDTRQAIGLTYRDHLIAVAAAGIDGRGILTIKQLQDVTGVRKANSGRAFFKTGLHNGLQWRDTLVAAWETVGEQLGVDGFAIQSNRNNRWQTVQGAGDRGYNDVAQRMGYVLDDRTGNWVRPENSTE
jgi:hypothetical protein